MSDSDGSDSDIVIDDIVYLAAQTRCPSGRLLIDEVIAEAGIVRAARKAKWTKPMILALEDRLLARMRVFYLRARSLETS
jgi:hypothetical protein